MATTPPIPDDFPARFVALGWQGIKEHYGVHTRVISAWLDEAGRADLTAARAAHVERMRKRDRAFRRRAAMLGLGDPAADRLRKLGTITSSPVRTSGALQGSNIERTVS
jgi:hypothetical protein